MLRLIGGLCVLLGSAAAGNRLVTRRRRGLEEWRQVLDACRLMERELRCREPTLPELLEHLSRHSDGPVRRHFTACARGIETLGSRTFAEIWAESLTASGLRLPRLEQMGFRDLGQVLGRYDRETQCGALLQMTMESEERLRRARAELRGQNRLYMTLSMAGGMLLVVLTC